MYISYLSKAGVIAVLEKDVKNIAFSVVIVLRNPVYSSNKKNCQSDYNMDSKSFCRPS